LLDDGLVMIGNAGSDVKISCKVELAVALPSVSTSETPRLPSAETVPEIRPVAGSTLNPAGRPVAATVAADVMLLAVI
jgi:hypothetical protein